MRIITGSAKGAKLKAPHGLDTRPTTDRVKESLFNILGNIVEDATVLDLFAGTGSLGLEALSRGARRATFIDQSAVSISVVKANAVHTKLLGCTELIKLDVLKALAMLEAGGRLFDIVFCDPPYNQGYITKILHKFDNGKIIAGQGILILEHSRHEPPAKQWRNLKLRRSERYGETMVSFFLNHLQQSTEAED